ncbi:IS1380 family transposase [Methylomarinum vadi]|uniref:IS1380 family transposase n=1 Tax=Methylomarinum vadi TaxID=438855 RepID=UPI0004DF59F9|nr:IS1380 family transposase [Methylomarinum vadi]
MKRFILEQSETEFYTSHSGLALVGLCLNQYGQLNQVLDKGIPLRHGIAHADIIKSMIGSLCLGKSDFEAIENYRDDDYFKTALSIQQVPSSARLRQRLDEHAEALLPLVYQSNIDFLAHAQVPVTPLATGHVALDIDVYPMNNEKTRKEGVSRTYKGFDGYAPIALYLGQEGWCLGNELREGKQHCQYEFLYSLERGLTAAKRLTPLPLLVRLDSGHDALDNRIVLQEDEQAEFIIKWNPRKQNADAWLAYAEQHGQWDTPREGKRVALFSVTEEHTRNGQTYSCRRVMQITERTTTAKGQLLLFPEIEMEGWWTSLASTEYDDTLIVQLYRDHATAEQFHSEFKTDLDIERLPSGKFATNDVIMTLSAYSYNILRWIGLIGLLGQQSPIRHPAKRRRIRTVIQELMYLAARLIRTGRRLKLRFSNACPGFIAFESTYTKLAAG